MLIVPYLGLQDFDAFTYYWLFSYIECVYSFRQPEM